MLSSDNSLHCALLYGCVPYGSARARSQRAEQVRSCDLSRKLRSLVALALDKLHDRGCCRCHSEPARYCAQSLRNRDSGDCKCACANS
ncbi:MAG: hypothetical protein OXR73_05345 [Myxococcales bacterium]|nr:hypothetical protein [Myxococcales bacterium]